jgi:hypothetical protein
MSPTVAMKRTTNHITPTIIHLPFPLVLKSVTRRSNLLPPASKKKVCIAITNDHIAAAMSSVFNKTP